MRRLVDGQEMAAVGQDGEVGQAAADVVLGHDRRDAASMTEMLPLRRLAASSVLPPSTIASATGWRTRRAGGLGQSARRRARPRRGAAAQPPGDSGRRSDGRRFLMFPASIRRSPAQRLVSMQLDSGFIVGPAMDGLLDRDRLLQLVDPHP